MSEDKWTDLFCRVSDREDGTPRFSLKGAKSYLYEYAGYSGGHAELDRIIKLLKSIGIKCHVSGADSPMNVRNTEYMYYFEDGGFEIYSGNYFFFRTTWTRRVCGRFQSLSLAAQSTWN